MAKKLAKRRANRYSSASRSVVNGFAWLMLGLVAGLSIAAFFYLKQENKLPTFAAPKPVVAANPVHKKVAHSHQHVAPKFDFYNILPSDKKEAASSLVAVSAPATPQTPVAVAHPDPVESKPTNSKPILASLQPPDPIKTHYMVQVASVKKLEDADKLKAELTLLGFDVNIQKITSGHNILNRVVIGPYDTVSAAQAQQERLRKNNISSIVVKLAG